LDAVLARKAIDEVLFATPTATGATRWTVAQSCAAHDVKLATLPNAFELLLDRKFAQQLRDMRVEETYGDLPINNGIGGDAVRSKSVLIVGAGGTIGSELARQVVRARPRHLTLLDSAETPLVRLSEELNLERRFPWTFPVIADASDPAAVSWVMDAHEPDIVFFAAGLSHARIAEFNLVHAARTNVMGAWATAQEAVDHKVERMIMVSSDNAAHARRRFDTIQTLAECAVRAHAGRGTVLAALRVGNIFRSSGSVVERFERQVSYGGPVTVTDAAVARRFVSRHLVGQRLLSLAEFAEDGAVYALDAGARVEIRDLAQRVIRMKGREPETDIEISFTGHRTGEKTSDALWTPDEQLSPTPVRDVVRIAGPSSVCTCDDIEALKMAVVEHDPAAVDQVLSAVADRQAASLGRHV
jgi:FlaA1/EpsC-like NDP-sugar epimerase